MKQMGLRFKFREVKEGDKVRLTEIGIKELEVYYGGSVERVCGIDWKTKIYRIHSVVPREFPYKIRLTGTRTIGLKKDEIKYA